MCIAIATHGLYLCGVEKHDLENLFSVLCECDSFLMELYLKNKKENFFLRACLLRNIFYGSNILFYYFYELKAALVKER